MSEPADHPLAGRALAAFRFDTRRALLRSMALSLPLMSVGVALAGIGLRHLQLREPARVFAGRATFQLAEGASGHVLPWEQALMLGGVLLIVLSNLVLVRALRRNLAIERFILLRADGLVRQVDTHYTLVPWDDVEQVCYAPERRAIVLYMRAGGEFSLADEYAGITHEGLAKLMRDVHRRAIWGLFSR